MIPNEHLTFKPYKTTYQGSYYGYTFEADIFANGEWEINWLESSPPTLNKQSDKDIENLIFSKIIESFGNSER